jgi:hypothetical protein
MFVPSSVTSELDPSMEGGVPLIDPGQLLLSLAADLAALEAGKTGATIREGISRQHFAAAKSLMSQNVHSAADATGLTTTAQLHLLGGSLRCPLSVFHSLEKKEEESPAGTVWKNIQAAESAG